MTEATAGNAVPSAADADQPADPDILAGRIEDLLGGRPRIIIGIVGAPGAGKSTLAQSLVSVLGPMAALVPMDGFHLSNRVLDEHGLRETKGAPDTFDAGGYVALLQRLARPATFGTVYAPEFQRGIEESISAAIEVPSSVRVVITEGNYLLLDQAPWHIVPTLLEQIWYLDTDENIRLDRLVSRHIAFGRDPETALRRATDGPDARNAMLIRATRERADLTLRPLTS